MKLNHSAFLFFICFFCTHALSSSKSSEKKSDRDTQSLEKKPSLHDVIKGNFAQLVEGSGIGPRAQALLARQKSNSPRSQLAFTP